MRNVNNKVKIGRQYECEMLSSGLQGDPPPLGKKSEMSTKQPFPCREIN